MLHLPQSNFSFQNRPCWISCSSGKKWSHITVRRWQAVFLKNPIHWNFNPIQVYKSIRTCLRLVLIEILLLDPTQRQEFCFYWTYVLTSKLNYLPLPVSLCPKLIYFFFVNWTVQIQTKTVTWTRTDQFWSFRVVFAYFKTELFN